MQLREHAVTITGQRSILRPMTEDDWGLLYQWNNDPEVLYFADGSDVTGYSLEDVQDIYRGVSQTAFSFMIEHKGEYIGECWLQQMNLAHILDRHPGQNLHRIDLAIGEKAFWGRRIGTEVIGLLAAFAFEEVQADRVYGCVDEFNVRSVRAFQRNGFRLEHKQPQPEITKSPYGYELCLTREEFLHNQGNQL